MNQRPDERDRVPPGIEDASAAAWREYEAACAALDRQIALWRESAAATAREVLRKAASRQPGDASLRAVAMSALRARPVSGARHRVITVDHVVQLARFRGRVCPQPGPWRCVHLLLPRAREDGRIVQAPAPIAAHAWNQTPDLRKQLTLRAQIEWAERHGALERLHDCLAALREQDWHHLSVLAWPALERPRD